MTSLNKSSRRWIRLFACLLAATFLFAVLPVPAAKALGPLCTDPDCPYCPYCSHCPGSGCFTGIEISRQPYRNVYQPGEPFDATGLLVLARYNNGTSFAVSNYTCSPSGPLPYGTTRIEVSCCFGGYTYRTWVPIQVCWGQPACSPYSPMPGICRPTLPVGGASGVRSSFPFYDIDEGDELYPIVKYLYENGIMKGVSERSFDTTMPLTRSMLATILYNAAGNPAVSYCGTFRDVPRGDWYTSAAEWAAAQGIIKGYDDGSFGPFDPVTREQLAAILHRSALRKGYAAGIFSENLADAGKISDYAAEAVNWAVHTGILRTDGACVRPDESAVRGEVAIAIYRYLQNTAA